MASSPYPAPPQTPLPVDPQTPSVPEGWRNLDSAFPPFTSGAPQKSVYERAGFDVRRGGRRPQSPAYPRSMGSHSRQPSQTPSMAASVMSGGSYMPRAPISRASSSLSNYAGPNQHHMLPQVQIQIPEHDSHQFRPAHSRDASKLSQTDSLLAQKAQIYVTGPPATPTYSPARRKTLSPNNDQDEEQQKHKKDKSVSQAESFSPSPESPESPTGLLPTTPNMIAPPQLTAGILRKRNSKRTSTRNSNTNGSERSSNASSIYSAGYDPLFDLSPRYDRTKSLLPYQREQLEQDDDHPSAAMPQMPPLEQSLNEGSWSTAVAAAKGEEGKFVNSMDAAPQQFSTKNSFLPNNKGHQIIAAPTNNDNANHLVSRSGSLASTSSQQSRDDSNGPRTPDDPNMTMGGISPMTIIIREEEGEGEENDGTTNNYSMSLQPQQAIHSKQQQQQQHQRKQARRKPKKGPCRGCGLAIIGKSVSSRDGKLSGRWHKECFGCAKCQTHDFQRGNVVNNNSHITNHHPHPSTTTTTPQLPPLPTTRSVEFYILNDSPLCHLCYHEDNNSLCAICGTGIEGECLDDGVSRYHPACLRCADCKTVLDLGAGFLSVVDGVFYCPAHAEFHASLLVRERERERGRVGGRGGGVPGVRGQLGERGERREIEGVTVLGGRGVTPAGAQSRTPTVEKRRTQMLMMNMI